jgi:adenine-specific DNA-methyltransferase
MAKSKANLNIDTLKHTSAKRTNIPTAEFESVMKEQEKSPVRIAYERRNRDLDPQLVWRGKDEQDWSDLVVHAPPLYIQEKVHPKVLIDDLRKQTQDRTEAETDTPSLFADFNGIDDPTKTTDFYSHQQNWTNRMILGDSLQVMASLAEREGLRGQVQCIYIDPPYGIKFNSNFQWSTTSRDVKDGNKDHITREPEQVKAFRDTWRDGIHSYLTYLRDRLTVARDLLADTGSIFVQIGDENVHRVRALRDEVFGEENFVQLIPFRKKLMPLGSNLLEGMTDYLVYYAKDREHAKSKFRSLFKQTTPKAESRWSSLQESIGSRRRIGPAELGNHIESANVYRLVSQRAPSYSEQTVYDFCWRAGVFPAPRGGSWVTTKEKMVRLGFADRLEVEGSSLSYVYFFGDFPYSKITNYWDDTAPAQGKQYVVQTNQDVIQRCILMTTDPGDLVLDPTCGSGTTATVAEQWGRRWITIDTSRVALAIARSRIMGARYPYYLLADTAEGLKKEAEISGKAISNRPTKGDLRQGFVYERVPHITLKSIANNTEIDVIYEKWLPGVTDALASLNKALKGHKKPFRVTTGGRTGKDVRFDAAAKETFRMPSGEEVLAAELLEWEVPREAPTDWPKEAAAPLAKFWEARIARQKEIDTSIAAKADYEYLYDRPYTDNSRVRVAGPFTVESISPHRMMVVDENDEIIDPLKKKIPYDTYADTADFAQMVLENLRTAGVQQAAKADRIEFNSLSEWPGRYICAEGYYSEGKTDRRAGIFIGPEFGTVARPDLVAAAREAGDAGFDVVIACAFNFDAHSSEFDRLGKVPLLKARMNPDLHMASDLKNTGHGNLFVVFGEPDVEILNVGDKLQVKIHGIDVFKPQTGEIVSDGPDKIALWFIDTDYNEESFFVRHAYFLGANDPYKALKTTLKAEIDEEAWSSLNSDISRPFERPASGRIAVKVINHLGDEVMKVFRV